MMMAFHTSARRLPWLLALFGAVLSIGIGVILL